MLLFAKPPHDAVPGAVPMTGIACSKEVGMLENACSKMHRQWMQAVKRCTQPTMLKKELESDHKIH